MVVRPQIDRFDQYIPYPQYLKLLLRATDATASGMKDFSGYARPVTNSTGATGSTGAVKLNPHSMYFDGTDDYFTVPYTTDFALETGNWTFSAWINPPTYSSPNKSVICIGGNNSSYSTLLILLDETWVAATSLTGSSWGAVTSFGTYIPNQWQHLAVIRDGNNITGYLNGVGTLILSTSSALYNSGNPPKIGSEYYTTPRVAAGYIDELMLWKGIAIPINQLYPQSKPFSFRRA